MSLVFIEPRCSFVYISHNTFCILIINFMQLTWGLYTCYLYPTLQFYWGQDLPISLNWFLHLKFVIQDNQVGIFWNKKCSSFVSGDVHVVVFSFLFNLSNRYFKSSFLQYCTSFFESWLFSQLSWGCCVVLSIVVFEFSNLLC